MKTIDLRMLATGMAASALLAGCNPLPGADETEGGPTRVRGQVVAARSGQPVARPPQVQLWRRAQSRSGSALGGGSAYGPDGPDGPPQSTDAQGRFDFGFEAQAGSEYVLRADEGGLGYYTAWDQNPAVEGGKKNEGVKVPVLSPVWVQVDLVDELPKNQVWFYFSGAGELHATHPRDTTLFFHYLDNAETFIYWRKTDEQGTVTHDQRIFNLAPLDTQRVRIAF